MFQQFQVPTRVQWLWQETRVPKVICSNPSTVYRTHIISHLFVVKIVCLKRLEIKTKKRPGMVHLKKANIHRRFQLKHLSAESFSTKNNESFSQGCSESLNKWQRLTACLPLYINYFSKLIVLKVYEQVNSGLWLQNRIFLMYFYLLL